MNLNCFSVIEELIHNKKILIKFSERILANGQHKIQKSVQLLIKTCSKATDSIFQNISNYKRLRTHANDIIQLFKEAFRTIDIEFSLYFHVSFSAECSFKKDFFMLQITQKYVFHIHCHTQMDITKRTNKKKAANYFYIEHICDFVFMQHNILTFNICLLCTKGAMSICLYIATAGFT